MCYWAQTETVKNRDGWFYKVREEWTEETGLSRKEQESARKKLRDIGVVSEVRKGIPAKVYFKVNFDVLINLLAEMNGLSIKMALNGQTIDIEGNSSSCIDGKNGHHKGIGQAEQSAHIGPSITEITTEITTDNKPLRPSDDESSDEHSSSKFNCPHMEILKIWAEVMPEKSKINPSLWAGTKRAKDLAARWKDGFSIKRSSGPHKGEYLYTNREEGIEWWKRFFMVCRKSDFLMGNGRPREETGKPFNPQFAWFVKRDNFVKILERTYHPDIKETHERPVFKNGIGQ